MRRNAQTFQRGFMLARFRKHTTATVLALIAATIGLATADEPANTPQRPRAELWFGTLDVGVAKLRLLVKLSPTDDGFRGILVSLDQDEAEIPCEKIVWNEKHLKLTVKQIQAAFEGELNADGTEAKGTWTQLEREFELVLRRVHEIPEPAVKRNRPQSPKPPFPYRSTDVEFENTRDGVTLAGTLTLPTEKGQYPAAVLISGSGPQDRDEAMLGHKPFHVLADYLTRRGIAVLRYDDRGVGESTGDHASGTTLDFANDVRAAVQFLANHAEVDGRRIGLIGHSEGGLVAPLVAAESDQIAFLVLLGPPGVTGGEILAEQKQLIARLSGADESQIAQSLALQRAIITAMRESPAGAAPNSVVEAGVELFLAGLPEDEREAARPDAVMLPAFEALASPWFRFFVDHDPRPVLQKVSCPVLALWGELDLQVTSDQNLPEVEKALIAGGNKNYKVVELPKLNHLLQTSQTGSPAEYATIEQTIAPTALNTISNWLRIAVGIPSNDE